MMKRMLEDILKKSININSKMVMTFFIVILLPVVSVTVVSVSVTTYILTEEVSKANLGALEQISRNIDLLLNNAVERLNTLYLNQDVIKIMESNTRTERNDYSRSIYADYESISNFQRITSVISEFSYSFSSIKSHTTALTPRGIAFTTWNSEERNFSGISQFLSKRFDGNESKVLWLNTEQLKAYGYFDVSDDVLTFTAVRSITSTKDGSNIGYLLLSISEKALRNIYNDFMSKDKNSLVFILDSQGYVVSYDSLNGSNALKGIKAKTGDKIKNGRQGYFKETLGGIQYLVSFNTIETSNWIILHAVPFSSLLREMSQLNFWIAVIIIFSFTVAFIISVVFSSRLSGRLKLLRKAMSNVNNEELPVKVRISSRDEIGDLSNSFNIMVDRIKNYMNQLIQEQEKKREMELDFLQAQINSHFLYNTLNSIKVLARLNRVSDINGLVTALIKLLRVMADKSSDLITIEKELDNLRHYVYIQKIRYMDKFDVSYNIERGCLIYSIPRLLLQPILENAIFHGIQDLGRKGIINISIFLKEGNVNIIIKDNGKGIEDNKLNEILKNNKLNSIGLSNVSERIKLYYGNNYGLSISSCQGEGTSVTIVLPQVF